MRSEGANSFCQVLRDYWHPVARIDEVQDKPFAVTLLDERLVLFRSGGAIRCFQDLCVHRGTPLSMGWIDGGNLVCAYHGWTYRADGACVRIPALPEEQPIPRKVRAIAYPTQERHGLVWVCLGEPKLPIADFPEYDDPSFHTLFFGRVVWNANAARIMENFMDVAHFAWIHDGVLGIRSKPRLPTPQDLRKSADSLRFKMSFAGGEIPGNLKGGVGVIDYVATLPFTVRQAAFNTDGSRRVITLAICPVSISQSIRFFYISRDYDKDGDDRKYIAFQTKVSSQDQPVVESQRPWEVPVDLAEEMHVRGPDTAAICYREMLAAIGIDS
jgi:vanillate O-demethylase monooxygenase subunit